MGHGLTMSAAILSLHNLGWAERKIARELQLDRKTVRRVLRQRECPIGVASKKISQSKCLPHQALIESKIAQGLSAKRIWQDLKDEVAFSWSYDSVKDFIHHLNHEDPSAFARMETSPGQEAQVDFGEGAPTKLEGKEEYKRPFLFVMTLSFSRHAYQEVVWRQDVETFIRCHERAFQFFGGIVRVVRLDNLKAGVLKAHLIEPELNRVYEAYAHHAGFIPVPCLPRTPEHKGKVESGVKYTQDNALKGMQFDSLVAQNQHLKHLNVTIALPRKHGTTKRIVGEAFEEEGHHLRPLPLEEFSFFRIAVCRVHADAFVEVDSSYYLAPEHLIGQDVQVHWNSSTVQIYHDGKLLVTHPKVSPGVFQKAEGLVPPTKTMTEEDYLKSLLTLCQDVGPDCRAWAEQVWHDRCQLGLRTLAGIKHLKKTFSKEAINDACAVALSIGSINFHTIQVLCENKSKPPELITQHEVIRGIEYYQQFINQGEME